MQTKQPDIIYILDPSGSGIWDGLKMIVNLVQKERNVGGDKFLKTIQNVRDS